MGNDFIEEHRGAPPESWAVPFRKALSLRGRPESRLKWYLIWVRRFAACLSGRPLHLATRNDAEGFLTTLASSPGIAAWQMEQATDALTILLGSVFGQEWARTIRPMEKHGATTCTRRLCSGPSGLPRARRISRSPEDV